jgi:hypothetical protein
VAGSNTIVDTEDAAKSDPPPVSGVLTITIAPDSPLFTSEKPLKNSDSSVKTLVGPH